jgi:hypothetical protein
MRSLVRQMSVGFIYRPGEVRTFLKHFGYQFFAIVSEIKRLILEPCDQLGDRTAVALEPSRFPRRSAARALRVLQLLRLLEQQ